MADKNEHLISRALDKTVHLPDIVDDETFEQEIHRALVAMIHSEEDKESGELVLPELVDDTIPGFTAKDPWTLLSDLTWARDVLARARELVGGEQLEDFGPRLALPGDEGEGEDWWVEEFEPEEEDSPLMRGIRNSSRLLLQVIQYSLAGMDQRTEQVTVRQPWIQGTLFVWLQDNWDWIRHYLRLDDDFSTWADVHSRVGYRTRVAYMRAVRFVLSNEAQAMLRRHGVTLNTVVKGPIDKWYRAAPHLLPIEEAENGTPKFRHSLLERGVIERHLVSVNVGSDALKRTLRNPARALADEAAAQLDDRRFVREGGGRPVLRLQSESADGIESIAMIIPDGEGKPRFHRLFTVHRPTDPLAQATQRAIIDTMMYSHGLRRAGEGHKED